MGVRVCVCVCVCASLGVLCWIHNNFFVLEKRKNVKERRKENLGTQDKKKIQQQAEINLMAKPQFKLTNRNKVRTMKTQRIPSYF